MRQLRVFLSSTFRDMKAEREALIKKAFPQLRRHCLERGAQLSVVDLRWGITRKQAEQRKVVGICLDMVEVCRPFFVCVLGQRYGWIPQRLEPSVLQHHPWIAEVHKPASPKWRSATVR